jgi:hypothetical protein
VDIKNHANGLKATEKKLLEVSIVRKGARQGCHIVAYQDTDRAVVYTAKDAWSTFDLT